jgi:hypothetical protein
MKNDTRFNIAPGALLLLVVAVLILLVVHKRLATADEVEKAAVKVERSVVRDSYSTVAVEVVVALFAYMAWMFSVPTERKPRQCRRPRSRARDKKGECGTTYGFSSPPPLAV